MIYHDHEVRQGQWTVYGVPQMNKVFRSRAAAVTINC